MPHQAIKFSTNQSVTSLPDDGFLRQRTLIGSNYVPFSATTLWRMVNAGKFPQPVKISGQITAWRVADVKQWAMDPANFAIRQTEVADKVTTKTTTKQNLIGESK